LELGTTPDSDTLTNATLALNVMIKAWQAQGLKLWTLQEYVVPLVASQNKYKLGNTQVKTGVVKSAFRDIQTFTTKITPKGQLYFYNKIKEDGRFTK